MSEKQADKKEKPEEKNKEKKKKIIVASEPEFSSHSVYFNKKLLKAYLKYESE